MSALCSPLARLFSRSSFAAYRSARRGSIQAQSLDATIPCAPSLLRRSNLTARAAPPSADSSPRAWSHLVARLPRLQSAPSLSSAHPRREASGVAVARVSSAEENAPQEQAEREAEVAGKRVRLGFIGAGQMAEAVARGLSAAGVVEYADMAAADVSSDRLAVFQGIGIDTKESAKEVAASSDVIFIAVKPFAVQPVLADLAASGALTERHLIVSIAAGVPLGKMQQWVGEDVRIVRVMPNTPCLVGATAAAMSLGARATEEDGALVKAMFGAVGEVYEVEERLLDAVTGLSGSGPAYVFVAIEALADGGTAAGLPRKVALSLAAQTVYGAAKMVIDTQKHPGQLKDSVASPAGTTIAGLHELEKGGFRSLLMNAVIAAANRSKEMSK
ncbi:hypothetical protein CLOM_g3826 [Closterium sp. NIES-68]|nr:hypothetical protein CLOM_g3826 [Closterium sp. NIES-68]GJP68137.1 hypothetical protein CLOP_g24878 [Closterium sp. NIES-67]GJP70934.1 hypothetical protein CLOP_g1826 [Closterium sp. NIES-67]